MMFRHPWLLLLALAIPALVWIRHHPRRRLHLPFSDDATLRALPVSWAARAARLLPALYAAGLLLLVVAAARPQRGLEESRVRTEAVDIVLLVDVSTSMRALDMSGDGRQRDRLEAARAVVGKFIEARTEDRLGLIAFAALPYTASPLTFDHDWLLLRLKDLKTGMVEDGTAIGSALASAVNRLRDSEAKSKVVILLTDGMNNTGTVTPDNAAAAAKAMGVKVYTIGVGTRGTAPYPVVTPFGTQYTQVAVEIDEALLTRIAQTTGGLYRRATDFDSLARVYEEINRLEKTEMDVARYTRYDERFAPWAAAGLALLLLERLLALTRLGGLPA